MYSATPIESYDVGGTQIFVKRDDLFATPPCPPVAKARGLSLLLIKLINQNVTRVGVFESSVSQVGLVLSSIARDIGGINPIVVYPTTSRRRYTRSVRQAADLGADIIPIRSNYLNICYAQAKRIVEELGGYMIPFGFDLPEMVSAVSAEARTVDSAYYDSGSVVVCTGSGVTASGILLGLRSKPGVLHAVSSGRSAKKISDCIAKYVPRSNVNIVIQNGTVPYHHALKFDSPFPTDPYYDLKAWKYLIDNIDTLPKPILFWNVGA